MDPFGESELAARHAWWQEQINARLPCLLSELLSSDVYGLGNERTKPPNGFGVYLFTSSEGHEYVGRTGLTERTERSGGTSYSGFANRLKGHLTATHSSGSWAYKRACDSYRASGRALAGSREQNCASPEFMKAFRAEIELIREMEFRLVAIESELLSAVFEMYAATVLGTRQQVPHELNQAPFRMSREVASRHSYRLSGPNRRAEAIAVRSAGRLGPRLICPGVETHVVFQVDRRARLR